MNYNALSKLESPRIWTDFQRLDKLKWVFREKYWQFTRIRVGTTKCGPIGRCLRGAMSRKAWAARAASTKTARNRYGSNLCFERAKSRAFEQKASQQFDHPIKGWHSSRTGKGLKEKNFIKSITCKQAFEGLKYWKNPMAGQKGLYK